MTRILCAFSILVVDRNLLKDTHRWRQSHVKSRQQTCFTFFMHPKSFNKPFEFSLLYKINRLHFSVCLYCKVSFPCSHRKNLFVARCECLHLIKQNSQCLFACCEFFLIRYKYTRSSRSQPVHNLNYSRSSVCENSRDSLSNPRRASQM